MSSISRYGATTLAAVFALGMVNYVNLSRAVTCDDCFFAYGVPFAFFQEGGYAGGRGLVWSGVAGDLLVVLMIGAVLGWTWTYLSGRLSN